MADWPQSYGSQRRLFLPNTLPGGYYGVGLVSAAGGGKGDWVELVSALPFSVALMSIRWDLWSSGGASMSVDIGIGPEGQERVIVPDITMYHGTQNNAEEILIPMAMPRGARVALRAAGPGTDGYGMNGSYTFFEATDRYRPRNTKAMSFGVSNGVGTAPVVASASAPWSGYNSLAGSCPYPIREVMVCISNNGSLPAAGVVHAIDIAYGSGVSVLPVIRGILIKGAQSCWSRYIYGPYPINLPAGGTFYAGSTTPNNPFGSPTVSVVGFW